MCRLPNSAMMSTLCRGVDELEWSGAVFRHLVFSRNARSGTYCQISRNALYWAFRHLFVTGNFSWSAPALQNLRLRTLLTVTAFDIEWIGSSDHPRDSSFALNSLVSLEQSAQSGAAPTHLSEGPRKSRPNIQLARGEQDSSSPMRLPVRQVVAGNELTPVSLTSKWAYYVRKNCPKRPHF